MPKCPKCKEEIKYLKYKSKEVAFGDYDDIKGYDEEYGTTSEIDFICPECSKILFTNEDSAYDFLKGGVKK